MEFDSTLRFINEEFKDEEADPELIEHVRVKIQEALKKEHAPDVQKKLEEMLKQVDDKLIPLSHKILLKVLNDVETINNMKISSYDTANFEF
jgi:hypothetical protein